MKPWFWRWQEESVRLVVHPLFGSKHANQFVNLIVIRFDFIIAYRPVVTQAVYIFSFKIIRTKSKGNPSPVVGSSTQHPRPEPTTGEGFPDRKSTRLNSSHV